MTMREVLLRNVVENQEDDSARSAFAAHVRASDPDLAAFIEEQLQQAQARRTRRTGVVTTKHPLLAQHEVAWTRTIAKYVRACVFDRGFVTRIEIEPEIFLEYGEYLFVLAPIRGVVFVRPEEGTFPMAALAASPLLGSLDTIMFDDPSLTESDLVLFASSPYLTRALVVSSTELPVSEHVHEAFAATSEGRKMLTVLFSQRNFPGQSLEDSGKDDWWGAPILAWTDLRPEGHALERKYGYIPWLHEESLCEPFDASYYVSKGILPVKPPGSPI